MGSEPVFPPHAAYLQHQERWLALHQADTELVALTEKWRAARKAYEESCEVMNRMFLNEVPSPHRPDALKQEVTTPVEVPTEAPAETLPEAPSEAKTAETPAETPPAEAPANDKRPRPPAGAVTANILRLAGLGPISGKQLHKLTRAAGAPKIARRLAQNGFLQQEAKTRFFILTEQGRALLETEKNQALLAQSL